LETSNHQTTRDTYRYQVRRKGKLIYRGLTGDMAMATLQHKEKNPDVTVVQVGRVTTHEYGLEWLEFVKLGEAPPETAVKIALAAWVIASITILSFIWYAIG